MPENAVHYFNPATTGRVAFFRYKCEFYHKSEQILNVTSAELWVSWITRDTGQHCANADYRYADADDCD